MELTVENRGGVCVITGKGELDAGAAARLKELFIKQVLHQRDRFVICMQDIVSIDSGGIGALLFIASTVRRLALRYCFAAAPEPVMRVLEKIGIAGYFSFSGALEEALETLQDEEPEELLEFY
ncbi:MAG: STAS domain-containing protein [Spirochaetaceae bacterium]|nr:STAS domain-containing protein [Spirochaetaceae bacterium]